MDLEDFAKRGLAAQQAVDKEIRRTTRPCTPRCKHSRPVEKITLDHGLIEDLSWALGLFVMDYEKVEGATPEMANVKAVLRQLKVWLGEETFDS